MSAVPDRIAEMARFTGTIENLGQGLRDNRDMSHAIPIGGIERQRERGRGVRETYRGESEKEIY